MGDFIKEFNVIDFLGILLPGAFLVLLLSGEFDVWPLMEAYWGETGGPNTAIRITLLLVGGYGAGTLLHEAGDLLEKALWKHHAFDPRIYAARSVGIGTAEAVSGNPRLSVFHSGKGGRPRILWTFIPLLIIWYGLFAMWASVPVIAIVWVVVFVFLLCGEKELTDRFFPDLAFLEQIRRADAVFLTYSAEENYKIRKRILFDGFRSMARNLFIAICILQSYAECSGEGALFKLLTDIKKNQLYALVLFLVQGLLLLRYWHFSYLKYKYCYEDYRNYSSQAVKEVNT